MKKLFMFLVLFSVLLCGCRADADSDVSEYYEKLAKAQEIAVFAVDTETAVKTFTSKEDIGGFVTALEIDEWELADLPQNAKEIGHFDFSRKKLCHWDRRKPTEIYMKFAKSPCTTVPLLILKLRDFACHLR